LRNITYEVEINNGKDALRLLARALEETAPWQTVMEAVPSANQVVLGKALTELCSLGHAVPASLFEDAPGLNRSPYRVCLLGNGPLVAALRSAIQATNLVSDVIEISEPQTAESEKRRQEQLLVAVKSFCESQKTRGAQILLALAMSEDEPSMCAEVGRLCASSAIAWVLFRKVASHFEIGPLVVPGETACFQCLTLRMLAAAGDLGAEQEYIRYCSTHGSQGRHLNSHPSLLQLAASVLAIELEGFCMARRVTTIQNGQWLVSACPLLVEHHRLLKIPGCPTCALGRNSPHLLSTGDSGEEQYP